MAALYTMPRNMVDWDIDKAYSLCDTDGDNCVYWQTTDQPPWHLTVVVDNVIGTDEILTDDGPYSSEGDAFCGGLNAALDWFMERQIAPDAEDRKKLLHYCAKFIWRTSIGWRYGR